LHLNQTLHITLDDDIKEKFVSSSMPKASEIKVKLIESIREETGINLVDKKINNFLRNFKVNN